MFLAKAQHPWFPTADRSTTLIIILSKFITRKYVVKDKCAWHQLQNEQVCPPFRSNVTAADETTRIYAAIDEFRFMATIFDLLLTLMSGSIHIGLHVITPCCWTIKTDHIAIAISCMKADYIGCCNVLLSCLWSHNLHSLYDSTV